MRKVWTHGFFTNTFNTETNKWVLTRTDSDVVTHVGTKAGPMGVLAQTLTKLEKIQTKRRNLEAQLALLIEAEDVARGKFSDAVDGLKEDEPEVDLTTLSRVELLDLAREKQIVGRDKMKKIELLEALQAL
ncbi:hypothetical protein HOH51_03900 [bacterium]|nr:hypothetical protein [bacterium]